MKKLITKIMALSLLSMIIGVQASATQTADNSQDNGLYLKFGAGFAKPDPYITGYPLKEYNNIGDSNNASLHFGQGFKAGYHIGGAVGWRFNKLFRSDISIGYLSANAKDGNTITLLIDQLVDQMDFSKVNSISYTTYMVNTYFDLDWGDGNNTVVPYLGAGIGAINGSYVGKEGGDDIFLNESTTSFAFQLILGAQYHLNQNIGLGLEYNWVYGTNFSTTAEDETGYGKSATQNNIIDLNLNYAF